MTLQMQSKGAKKTQGAANHSASDGSGRLVLYNTTKSGESHLTTQHHTITLHVTAQVGA